jgi:hypothetical protein
MENVTDYAIYSKRSLTWASLDGLPQPVDNRALVITCTRYPHEGVLGIYQLGVSPTLINPASPGWPKGGKAKACRAAQIADVQGSRRTVQGRRKA